MFSDYKQLLKKSHFTGQKGRCSGMAKRRARKSLLKKGRYMWKSSSSDQTCYYYMFTVGIPAVDFYTIQKITKSEISSVYEQQ